MTSNQLEKRGSDPSASLTFVVAEQDRARRWWTDGEVEFLSKNETLSGFVLHASYESVMLDKPSWTILHETGNSSDKVLVSQFRFLPGALARSDSPMTQFFQSPPPNFSLAQTPLGKAVVGPIPPPPKVTSKRIARGPTSKQADYRIPILDGDFDQHESLIAVQASLINYYRHLSPAGGFISLDAVALQLTKDTFCSTFHLTPSESTSLVDIVIPFQIKIQNALVALSLVKLKRSDGKFDAATAAAVKQFQADFNRKSPTIRAICLNYPIKSPTLPISSHSSGPSSTTTTGPNDTIADSHSTPSQLLHHASLPPSTHNDPSLQIRTDGDLEHRTVCALFAYVTELKSYLDSFGFPTPSDPFKTPKRFKSIFAAIKPAMEAASDPSNADSASGQLTLASVPAFVDECGLANKLNLECGKPVPDHLKDNVVRLLQISSSFKPKEKKKPRRLSVGTPSAQNTNSHANSEQLSAVSTPSKIVDPMRPIAEVKDASNTLSPQATTSGSPKAPYDSPRRSVTSPITRAGKPPTQSNSEAQPTDAPTYIVFDREYHQSVHNWMSEIEIVDFSVTLTGYKLYIDPSIALSRTQTSAILVRGDPKDMVTGMAIRLKSKAPNSLSPLLDYHTRTEATESRQLEKVHTAHGFVIVEILREAQIMERKLIRCPEGQYNPHVSTIRIQATLVRLGCQAKDFEYSLASSNSRSQDQLYLKYKMDRSIAIGDALFQVVQTVQVCLIALNCLELHHISPWYSNYVIEAMLKFEHDYEQARESANTKKLTWAAGFMTFIIYEELVNQTKLFHNALLDLGFPVKCTPFEDIVQFHTYTVAYRQAQQQLSDALHSSAPLYHQQLKASPRRELFASAPPEAQHPPSDLPIPSTAPLASAVASSLQTASQGASSTSAALNTTGRSSAAAAAAALTLSPLLARQAPPELGYVPLPTTSSAPVQANSGKSGAPNQVGNADLAGNGAMPSSTAQRLSMSPTSMQFVARQASQQTPVKTGAEASGGDPRLASEIEFGSSLASKYKAALQEHEELLARYSTLEETFLELSNDAADANTSLQFFEEQYKETVQNYDQLLQEYDALKRVASQNEDEIQLLVRNVGLLETKLQKLQRVAQRSFTTNFLWSLILIVLYLLLLPALGITFLVDLYRSKFQNVEISESNSIRARLRRYSKHQLSKLERVVDDLEAKMLKWTGAQTFSPPPTKEKRN